NHPRRGQVSRNEVESRQGGGDWQLGPGDIHRRTLGEEKLHAVVQFVLERDLGDCDVDGDLHSRTVELGEGSRDDLIVLLVGVNNYGIVGDVGGDAHARQRRASGTADARPGRRAEGSSGRDGGGGGGFGALALDRRRVGR